MDLLALAVEVVAAELHRSCEGNGAPQLMVAFEQNLRCGSEPCASLRRGDECDEQSGIEPAGADEELNRSGIARVGFFGTS